MGAAPYVSAGTRDAINAVQLILPAGMLVYAVAIDLVDMEIVALDGIATHSRHSCYFDSGGALMTGRTSIGILSGTPPGPGAAEIRAATA